MIKRGFAADTATINALTRTADVFEALQVPDYAKEFHALAGMSIETEKMMATLDVGRGFADLLAVLDVTRSMVEDETGRLNRAYAGFGASILNRPDWLDGGPLGPGALQSVEALEDASLTPYPVVAALKCAEMPNGLRHNPGYNSRFGPIPAPVSC